MSSSVTLRLVVGVVVGMVAFCCVVLLYVQRSNRRRGLGFQIQFSFFFPFFSFEDRVITGFQKERKKECKQQMVKTSYISHQLRIDH